MSDPSPVWVYDPNNTPRDIAISNDGNYIIAGALGGFDGDIYLFHKSSSTPLWSKDLDDWVYDVDISANGSYIVASGGDNYLYFLHKSSSTPIWGYNIGDYGFYKCAISDDGFWIAAGHSNHYLYMFNKTSSTPMWSYNLWSSTQIHRIDMSSDGSIIAVWAGPASISLFTPSNPNPIGYITTYSDLRWFDLSEDGKWLVTTDDANRVRLYNTSNNLPVWTNSEFTQSVSISGDGQYIAASGDNAFGSHVYLYDKTNSTPIWRSFDLDLNLNSIRISADGTSIAVGTGLSSGTDRLIYFNSDNRVPLWNSTTTLSQTRCMEISSDGSYIAVGDGANAGVAQFLLFHQDKTPPIWDENPLDQIIEFGNSFKYDINASDSAGIASYWINDTANFNISTNGLITNKTALSVGDYPLEIRAYDPYNNYCSVIISITVVDTTPPLWDSEPKDQTIEFRTKFFYDINATDLSGISYYWINDSTNFNIDTNGYLNNATSLDAGIYRLEIRAYDPFDNYCSKVINISVVDSTPPIWDSNPADQFCEFGMEFSYDVDASDLSGIAYYWLNDTSNFDVDPSGLITNSSALNIGVYWIEVRAYNPSDNFCSAIINITAVDTTPPTWNPDPVNQIIQYGTDFLYDVDASDLSGIAYYWINDTSNFDVDPNGLITNASLLSVGDYWIEIRAVDTSDNNCSSTLKISVEIDIINPSWDTIPIDQIIDFGSQFSYDVNASDLSGIAYYWINDTINFNIDSNGLITNALSLNTGEYWIEIRAYDPYDNYCTAIIKLTVNQPERPPNISGYEISILIGLVGIITILFITYTRRKREIVSL